MLRAKVQGGANNWDVVQVESEELLLGCEEGLFDKLDWAKLGGRDKYLPDAVSDCGVGAIVYSFVLAYDGDKIKDGPKNWADFWNTQKWPGKRALRKGPKTSRSRCSRTASHLRTSTRCSPLRPASIVPSTSCRS